MAKARDSNTGERSLYECFHARVKGRRIFCAKRYRFQGQGEQNAWLDIERLAKGEPLVMSICQDCTDFESMGAPIPCEERGWLKETREADLQIQGRKTEFPKDNKERVVS